MTGRVVVDTSIMVDHLRGRIEAGQHLLELRRGGVSLYASIVSKIEILAGLRPGEATRVSALFTLFDWVPVDGDVAERAGALAAQYRHSHAGIDLSDYIIAATCQSLGASLSTLNVKHFPMLAGLERPY